MLKPILGTQDVERALIFTLARGEGYAKEISDFFDANPTGIRRQLAQLEEGGVLISNRRGKTLLYAFNPRYPFLAELQALLTRALDFYPEELRQALLNQRRRPRRQGKGI